MNNEVFCVDLDLASEMVESMPEDEISTFRSFVLDLGEMSAKQSESSGSNRLEQLQILMRWNNEN